MASRILYRAWEKNAPEIRAIAGRTTPTFLRNRPVRKLGSDIPVFVFHSVEPKRFESQLLYLKENNYSTVTSDELELSISNPLGIGHRKVALTFDDATGSFWAIAYPLLKKYDLGAILFVVAGIVPDDKTDLPNLDDVWAGQATMAEVRAREQHKPLCTWRELLAMHESRLVDIQSHSLTHTKVPISEKIVDFVSPEFDPCFFGNVDLPISATDNLDAPERNLRAGAPIYESLPRLSGVASYFSDPQITDAMTRFVAENGGEEFFLVDAWRDRLQSRYQEITANLPITPIRETREEYRLRMRTEFSASKKILEEKIPDKQVLHFCYPWFSGCTEADELAHECGYKSVHYGFELPRMTAGEDSVPTRIRRYSDDYIWSLPGKGRRWPYNVWVSRICALAARKR